MGPRQLVLAVEATGALGASWPVLLVEYVEKIVRAFYEETNVQKLATPPGEMALIVFDSHGPHSGSLLQQSGWTSSIDVFFKWLSSISFLGGGFGEAAIAEALAEALMMCCPGPIVPPASQSADRQKHCVLIAASNPYPLHTPVIRPPVPGLLQSSPGGELQAEQWWLADAETVAKTFPTCQVSLSIIAPRQLPLLRSVFNAAKRNARALDSGSDTSKQYPQHLVLLSEGFMEGRIALRRTATASNATVQPGIAVKPEPLMTTTTSAQGSSATARPSSVATNMGGMMGRQAITNGTGSANMESAPGQVLNSTGGTIPSLVHNNVSTPPLQMQANSTSGISGPESLQTSDTSATSQGGKLGTLAANSVSLGILSNTSAQPRHVPGTTTLGAGSGVPAGMPGASVMATGAPSSLTSGQAATLTGTSNIHTGVGAATIVMAPGMAQNNLGGGPHTVNNVGTNGGLVSNPSVQPGVVQLPVAGPGQTQANSLGVLAGIGITSGGLGMAGVSAGTNPMVATPGPTQTGQAVPSLGPNNALVPGSGHVASPPQQVPGTLKYTRLWVYHIPSFIQGMLRTSLGLVSQFAYHYRTWPQGILAGQRQRQPVPICKLEAYRQTSSSEKLAADWPPTMQIVRLIAQDYMNSKDYQGKAELLVFRPLSQHLFLVQLADKKLCAVIQLPSQTLLLASTDKPGRMIGMLFPGDMVVFKPQPPSSGQQGAGAGAAIGGTGQALVGAQTVGAQTIGAQTIGAQSMGQQTFSQGSLNTQQQIRPQPQLNPGPVSLQGNGFLP